MQLPLIGPKHLNRGLFSDYYLDELVPTRADWLPMRAQARGAFEALRQRLDSIRAEELDEAQLEDQWIKFVFEQIGWHWSVQVKIRFQATGYRKPDYALTPTAEIARALTGQIYTPDELRLSGIQAVADAKKWGVSLDQAARGERNPSQQIDEYLRYSELPWGILTDGRYWRLYERESSKNNIYYAVDLKALLESGDLERFLYFYAFFRQPAYAPNGWLDAIRSGSSEFAQNLSEKLEDQVYDALELIAQGFLDYRRNGLEPTPDNLHELYQQSLVLLYRLLFILYAESRDILPLSDNTAYRQTRSFHALKTLIAQPGLRDLDPDGSDYYARLKDLFYAIDQGNPRYSLPAYNGGLFSSTDHPFLDRYIIGDQQLAPALDKMARVPDKDHPTKLLMVDYRDLEVRHLGAIYEKLLDYQLAIATEPLTVKEDTYVSAAAGESVVKQVGAVYLRTGNNQRKVTGSYYTPDYIVRFIVERTLEPLLTEITERYATRDAEGNWIVREPEGLRAAILALNVLDPATGSGHFMVDAMAYIAEWLRSLSLAPADLVTGEDELLYWKRQVVLACIYGVDVNPLAVELAKLSLWLATLSRGKPLSFLDHHIRCGNTLIGARADEIGLLDEERKRSAKAKKTAQVEATGQLSMFSDAEFAPTVSFAIDQMTIIEHTLADTIDQVKQQGTLYADLTKRLSTWRRTADAWAAHYFGITYDKPTWDILSKALRGKLLTIPPVLKAILDQADQLAQTHRFLHWELVFPEVFFKPDGTKLDNPGFDAVIGNPPYVRQEYLAPIKPYLATAYADVYNGSADLYVYFYRRGLQNLRAGGYLAYITANKWFRSGYGEGLRGYLAEKADVREIVDFGHAPIFKDADTFPAVMVIRKPQTLPIPDAAAQVTIFPREELKAQNFGETDLKNYIHSHRYQVPMARLGASSWSLERGDVDGLMVKLRQVGIPLRDFINAEPLYGIKTGFNEAFLIDTTTKERLISEDSACANIIKPFLRGENIERWSPNWDEQWLILVKSSENQAAPWSEAGDQAERIFAQTYPSIYAYFKPLESRLRHRQDQGRFWWELRSCAYYQVFEAPKLVYQVIQSHSAYSLDTNGYFTNDKCYCIPGQDLYLLGLLNSPVMWWFGHRYFGHMINDALNPSSEKMVSLPIAPPTDAIRAQVEPAVQRLIDLTKSRRERVRDVLSWLRVEFAVATPGQKLEAFAGLTESVFIDEVKKRRPGRQRLTAAGLRQLTDTFRDYAAQIKQIDDERDGHERRISELVNQAYGLTAEDIDLMWRTAPPRMPLAPQASR